MGGKVEITAEAQAALHLSTINHAILTPLVRSALNSDTVAVTRWDYEQLPGNLADPRSFGALVGAGFAGARSAGDNPTRCYAFLGLISAAALALFACFPVGFFSMVSLAVLGAATFAQAVWNTSRIQEVAKQSFQARLQALTSMAFTLGFTLGMLWAGIAIDAFGLAALVCGAVVLGVLSVVILIA